jgi:hypothetical protein
MHLKMPWATSIQFRPNSTLTYSTQLSNTNFGGNLGITRSYWEIMNYLEHGILNKLSLPGRVSLLELQSLWLFS